MHMESRLTDQRAVLVPQFFGIVLLHVDQLLHKRDTSLDKLYALICMGTHWVISILRGREEGGR